VRPRWLVPGIVLAMMLIEGAPMLASQFLNGRRYDFKTVSRWLEPRLTPGDVIFSDQPVVLGFYLPQLEIERLRYDTAPLAASVRKVRRSGPSSAVWIVAPSPGHAFRTNLKQGGLADWMYDHCQLRNYVGMGRVDFREQYLQVYRCPPGAPSEDAATRGPRPAAGDHPG
jgi:hypothetical protein